ncbi:autotransporter domain-containing protein [Glaciimonas sp. GG7]
MSVTKTTKDASCIAISLLLIGCGGGGGGAQNPGNPATIPTTTRPVVTPTPEVPVERINHLFDSTDPSRANQAQAQGLTGRGVTVGIVDGDFQTSHPEFNQRLTKKAYKNGGIGNGSPHGTWVAEAIGGRTNGIARGVSMVGAAGGSIGNTKTSSISGDMFYDLQDRGVNIVNLSLGGGDITKERPTPGLVSAYQSLVKQGMLFIWATGNESQLNPSPDAGMPDASKALQEGWLAVTAVNAVGGDQGYDPRKDKVAGDIASYANRCGVAANWCLAAPGDFFSATTNERVHGTSFATPAVTGAAALVQEAYPWMSNSLLRQTILSTATDMNDRKTYGWGLLNTSKAVKGLGAFDTRLALGENVVIDFNDVSAEFSNDISGDAGLIKQGTGTLTLSGNNTYTGNNRVNNGVLNLTGSVRSDVAVNIGKFRADNGRVGGSVINDYKVSVAGKGLDIGGDFISKNYSTLEKEWQSSLTVGGEVKLEQQVELIMTSPTREKTGYVTAQGKTENVLRAQNGVKGRFDRVSFMTPGSDKSFSGKSLFLDATLDHTDKSIDLTVKRNDVATLAAQAFASDATRTNSAENLEKVLRVADDLVATGQTSGENAVFLMNAAALQQTENLAAAADVFDSLSGQIHSSAQALTFQQSQSVNRDLSNRLAQLGSNATAKTGLWSSVIASSGKLKQHGYASANTTLSGGQFGIDTRLNDKTIVGAALAYSDSTASFNRFGGQSKSQNIGVSLYGRHAFEVGGVNAYVSGRGGIATVDSNVSRTAIVGSKAVNLNAKHTDQVLSAYLETGYDHPLTSNTSMTPFAGLSYDRVKRGDFNESGNTFGLSANSQSYQQSAGLLGVRANSQFNWSGGKSNVQMYAAWQHTFDGGNLDFSANYNGVAGTQLSVKGIGLPRNTGWVGIGVATDVSKRWGWFANYDAQFGQAGKLNNVVSAGIRIHLD